MSFSGRTKSRRSEVSVTSIGLAVLELGIHLRWNYYVLLAHVSALVLDPIRFSSFISRSGVELICQDDQRDSRYNTDTGIQHDVSYPITNLHILWREQYFQLFCVQRHILLFQQHPKRAVLRA